jgi:hypothetical protein
LVVKFSGGVLQSATYGHVEAYECKKVLRVRIPLSPPYSLNYRDFRSLRVEICK